MNPRDLADQIALVLPSLSQDLTQLLRDRVQRLVESLDSQNLADQILDLEAEELLLVMLYSPFVSDHLARCPQDLVRLVESRDLVTPYPARHLETRLVLDPEQDDLGAVKKKLLDFKHYEAVRIAWRDLAGRAGLEETMADMSSLAQACVAAGFDYLYHALCRQWGKPLDSQGKAQEIIVLGMGKLGAFELNFSSDIDLIFAYLEDGVTTADPPMSNNEFFTRLCRAFVKLFTIESGGHLFRVDTRLRPYGESGPLVMSAAALEDYYQAQGREWERYAMIKARPVAGDLSGGEQILKGLNPFVYRRYFDYGSFDSFREMKQRISLQVKNEKLSDNIKLGAGGIREIEFFGQLFQLIRGGVEPALQERPILKVLTLLKENDLIDSSTCETLTQAYRYLRQVENRLQEYQDRQTHDLPSDPAQQQILALSMGARSFEAFEQELKAVQERVHRHFSQLLVKDKEQDRPAQDLNRIWTHIDDPQFLAEAIAVAGYEDPDQVLSALKVLAAHPNTQRLTANGRKKLARLVPGLVRAAGRAEAAEAVLAKLIDLVITIERRTCYLSLLIENQAALDNLVTLATKSPWIISFLSQHPALMDELMHPGTLYAPPKKDALEREMARRMTRVPKGDQEFLLEELNIFRQVNTLRVAAADVSGNYPIMKVSDHLTYIAETVLSQVLFSSWEAMSGRYGIPEGVGDLGINNCGFAILAYGKVGGLEMGYKSDLDLVFLFRADQGVTQGGPRSIETIRFYSNLGQRIIHALTMHTSAGTLYGADMRLRPGGDSGTIVSHIEAYEEYLEDQAWTWEHQALIRARAVAGDLKLAETFNQVRQRILTRKRDPDTLKSEVREMRERMRKQRLKSEPGIFDLKQGRGGIVDIEFLVQYLVLKHAHDYPDVVVWTDNVRLMEGLSVEGLISGEESQTLQEAYISMRKVMHRLTLQEKKQVAAEGLFDEKAREVAAIYDRYLLD